MRELACQCLGITAPVLGKVTLEGVPKRERAVHVYAGAEVGRRALRGYRAVVCEPGSERVSVVPSITILKRQGAFCEGDVILVDPAEGRIRFLYERLSRDNALLVTERCNCRCVMCPQPPRSEEESKTRFNIELIRLMAPGPQSLAITGGEPTLLGEELMVVLTECRRCLPETNVIILTNGRRFRDREYVEGVLRVGHERLTFAVALYADVERIHDGIVRSHGAFSDTLNGLYNLALYSQAVEIRVVITAMNWERLAKIADFIFANLPFASHVAFMGLETTGLAAENLDRVWIDPGVYVHNLEVACRCLQRRMIPVSIYNLPLCVLPRSVWSVARQSISDWKNIYLPECQSCSLLNRCAGFFASGIARLPSKIGRGGVDS